MMLEVMAFFNGNTIVKKFALLNQRVRGQAKVLGPLASSRVLALKICDDNQFVVGKNKEGNKAMLAYYQLIEFAPIVKIWTTLMNKENAIYLIEWLGNLTRQP